MGRTHHKKGICQDRKDLPPSPRIGAQDWQLTGVVDGEVVAAAGSSNLCQRKHEPSGGAPNHLEREHPKEGIPTTLRVRCALPYPEGVVHEDEQWAIRPTQS